LEGKNVHHVFSGEEKYLYRINDFYLTMDYHKERVCKIKQLKYLFIYKKLASKQVSLFHYGQGYLVMASCTNSVSAVVPGLLWNCFILLLSNFRLLQK